MISRIVLTFLMLIIPVFSFAQTGNDYMSWGVLEKSGYAIGFYHGYTLMAFTNGKDIVPGVTFQQISDIITNYITTHPKDRHLNLMILSSTAIGEVFPLNRLPALDMK